MREHLHLTLELVCLLHVVVSLVEEYTRILGIGLVTITSLLILITIRLLHFQLLSLLVRHELLLELVWVGQLAAAILIQVVILINIVLEFWTLSTSIRTIHFTLVVTSDWTIVAQLIL